MRLHKLLALALVAAATPLASHAQNITTVVGGGPINLPKTARQHWRPWPASNLIRPGNAYFIDNNFSRLAACRSHDRKGQRGRRHRRLWLQRADVVAIQAQMNEPSGLCIDANDNVFIADSDNNIIREYVVNDPQTAGHLVDVVGVQTVNNPTFGGDGGPAATPTCTFRTDAPSIIAEISTSRIVPTTKCESSSSVRRSTPSPPGQHLCVCWSGRR